MNNEKKYFFREDVYIKFSSKSIFLRKGIWNFVMCTIEENIFEDKKEWKNLLNVFKLLISNGCSINKLSKNLKLIIEKLIFEDWIYSTNDTEKNKKYDCLITDLSFSFFDKNFIHKFDFSKINLIDMLNLNLDNVLFVVTSPNINKIIEFNKFFLKNNIKVTYLFTDGDFIHIIFIENYYQGCFECFNNRSLLQMDPVALKSTMDFLNNGCDYFYNNNNLKQIKYISMGIKIVDSLLFTNFIVKNNLLKNKVISIYIPTFEVNIDYISKIPNCLSCGISNRKQNKIANFSVIDYIRDAIKNEKR